MLGQDALQSDGETRLARPRDRRLRRGRFEALIRDGSRDALSAAADLYRDRFLDDVAISEEAWNDWLTGERERLKDWRSAR